MCFYFLLHSFLSAQVLENKEYSLADTYPRYLVLPALMTKDEIRIAAGTVIVFAFAYHCFFLYFFFGALSTENSLSVTYNKNQRCYYYFQSLSMPGFRSKARLPVVTYLHGPTGAVLTRSAQPMVGLGQKNCAADAKLLNLYRCKGKALEAK